MWIFLKKFYRDLGESKGQFISVLAVVIIGVMFYTGLNSALEGLSGAGNRYFTEYRLADIWSSVYRAPEGVVKRIEDVSGVKMVTGRVVQDVRISMEDRNAMVRLISLPDNKKKIVNDIQLKSGSYFSDDAGNQCIVSDDFFRANNLTMGQIIEPIINGDRVKLKVIGTAKSPEYTYEIREANELIPNPEKFGVVYVKKSYLQAILDFKGSVNDISVLLNQDGDVKKVKEEMKKVLRQYGLTSTVEKKDQLSYSMFSSDVKSLKSLAAIFPMLFFIASAVIIYITMTRMIENQRTLMGVLKALGYSNLNIMLHYQTYPILVGVLGSIAGSLMGVFVVGEALLNLFNTIYNLPTVETTAHLELILPAAVLALLFCVVAGYNACRKELRLVPAESMRPKPPASVRKMLLENLRLLWQNINFSWKIILRNLFRYKRRSAMASMGIIFSMMLLLVALAFQNSMDNLMDMQFNEIQKFDIKVIFSKIMDIDELGYIRSMDHIGSVEPILESGMEITSGWRKKDIGIIALDRESELYGVSDVEGYPVEIPLEGILLPARLMDTLGLQVGDKVYLRSFYPGKNEDRDKKAVTVKGITSQYIGQSAICSTDYLNYLLREGMVTNAAYIRLEDLKYEKEVIESLKDILNVSTIQSKSEVVANTKKTLKSMSGIIVTMVLGAGILAFAVIYNITNINIFERRREIATLSVLGFTTRELRSLVFNENFFLSTFGILVGIPPGRYLADIVITMQANDNLMLPAVLKPSSYFIAVVLIGIFTLLANLLLVKKIQDINMVESLKSAE
ncbi:MAG TPA: FtsX-like permease family protein [Clostridia bacterium]|nr:FtsX-like permease family protein [Clostridia bacterium]